MGEQPKEDGFLDLDGVTKSYDDFVAVRDLSLRAQDGELVSLLGPSGCGKTTTLRMIAGFLQPDEGEIYIDGAPVAGVPSHKRQTAMVFQNYALFPHMTVLENVAYGLKMRRVRGAERRQRAAEVLDLVQMPSVTFGRAPKELSGGQQQRVALARALVVEPKLLLLDEPLSNLDAKLRKSLRQELRDIHDRVGTTTIFVTHDLEEAFELSDRIAVMNAGCIEQFATPFDLYAAPRTEFVADFVGHSNIMRGTIVSKAGESAFTTNSGLSFEISGQPPSGPATVVLPQGRIEIKKSGLATAHNMKVRVIRSRNRGHLSVVSVEDVASGERLEGQIENDRFGGSPEAGAELMCGWNPTDAIVLADDTAS